MLATGTIMKNIHIGKIIHEKFKESNLSISEFAMKINRTRGTVYDIFSRKSIDTDLLIKISETLHYDFLKEYYPQEESQPAQICKISFNIDGIIDARLLCSHLSRYKKNK